VSSNGGSGGTGGAGSGAAVFNGGSLTLLNCTVVNNSAIGPCGGRGGDASGTGNGGSGGAGGLASGALYDTNGLLALTNCTVALNVAVAGSGGSGGTGGSAGGSNGSVGTNGAAHGGLVSSGGTLINCLLSTNTPANCFGRLTDAGHNLSSDNTCAFTNIGSLNNTDPQLGPLANYGGPTLTMALLFGSPAIDAGDTAAAPAADQRGYPRVGLAADIGAFEYGSPLSIWTLSRPGPTGLDVIAIGITNRTCVLLTSPDLMRWTCVATNQLGSDGRATFHDDAASGGACKFYRLVMP